MKSDFRLRWHIALNNKLIKTSLTLKNLNENILIL